MPPLDQPGQIFDPDTGQTLYYNPYSRTYTTSRSYGLRMQRGFLRGDTRQTARSHQAAPQTTEAATRRERFLQRYQVGYYTWQRWQRLYIREINERSFPTAQSRQMYINEQGIRHDPRIFLADAIAVRDLYASGFRDPVYPAATWQDWFELRLQERLNALIDYQDLNDRTTGHRAYQSRRTWVGAENIWIGQFVTASPPPIELWYYH